MYPSVVTTFSTKANGQVIDASDVNNLQTDVVAIETFVGTEASTAGTLFYDIRAAASGGGGHVQAVNKGGTAQTSFTKGDILIASSSSVLTKLAVGTNTQVLTANSGVATGVDWETVSASLPYARDGGTGSVMAIYPVPCVTSYIEGNIYATKVAQANTVASPALSISSLVAKKVQNIDGTSLAIGQIPASSISLFAFDSVSSVFQLLNPTTTFSFKNGVTNHDISVVGVQSILHGLGKIPKNIRIRAAVVNGNSTKTIGTSDGVYNGASVSTLWVHNPNNSATTANDSFDSTYIVLMSTDNNLTNYATATPTMDATSITLTWAITGGPTGNANMAWEAMG